MSRQAGWLAQCGLYGDCYTLCLPLCLFGFRSQVVTSVGRRCSTLSGRICRSRLCVLGSGDWEIVYWGHGFSLLWHGGHPRLLVVWSMLLVPREPPLIVPFVVSFVRVGSLGVSLFSLSFLPLPFRICFLGLLKSAWSWRCGGQHCWGRVIPGGLRLAMLRRISFVSCSFFCYSWPLGHREA